MNWTRNTFGIAALGSLAYGLWLAWPPLAFIGSGAAVLAFVVLVQHREKK